MTSGKVRALKEASRPLYDTVYEALRQRIIDGSFRAGETLSEVQLAEMLAVSRTPVRDAIRRLVAENLLVAAKGAVRVYSPTAADLADVYCTRATLEGLAARLAASRADTAFVNRLIELCDQCAGLDETDIVHTAAKLNGDFHQAILDRAGNGRISSLLGHLNPVVVRYRHISLTYREHLTQSWEEHRTIARLFAECSPSTVEHHVRTHILRAGGRIVAAMRALEGPGEVTPAMELVLNA